MPYLRSSTGCPCGGRSPAAFHRGLADNQGSAGNYDNLYAAALCRAKADWLIGINGTRLFTTLYQGKTLNVGRVQTPTLNCFLVSGSTWNCHGSGRMGRSL